MYAMGLDSLIYWVDNRMSSFLVLFLIYERLLKIINGELSDV